LNDVAYSIIQTKDGGYVVAGWTWNFGHGKDDAWVIKLDKNGNKIWDKTFGGKLYDDAYSIVQTKDGGYVVAGKTYSFGHGKSDVWVIKLDKNGNKIWDKTFGGKLYDEAYSIVQTKDGGYVVAGWTRNFGHGKADAWIIKLDKNGNKIWDKTFGGKLDDGAYSIVQTKDGGYVVAGRTWSFGHGKMDAWIIKLDKDGNKIWDKTFGGKLNDAPWAITQTKSGGYAIAGATESFGNGSKGKCDMWIIKLDKRLIEKWNK